MDEELTWISPDSLLNKASMVLKALTLFTSFSIFNTQNLVLPKIAKLFNDPYLKLTKKKACLSQPKTNDLGDKLPALKEEIESIKASIGQQLHWLRLAKPSSGTFSKR